MLGWLLTLLRALTSAVYISTNRLFCAGENLKKRPCAFGAFFLILLVLTGTLYFPAKLYSMADPIVWGLLPKAQDNPQTINEAIAAAIADHEADPEAHLGEGESLEMHRANEMIDHPAGSVAVDKFAGARFITTCFESLDAWQQFISGTGTIESQLGSANLRTGATSGGKAALWVVPDGFIGLNMAKAFFWRTTLKFSVNTAVTSYFGLGYLVDEEDFNGFGFRNVDGVLHAWMGDFTNLATISIAGIDLSLPHTYEIRYTPDPQVVEYWIDGVMVASFDSGNFPEDSDEFAAFEIRSTASAIKALYLTDFMYQQER